MISEKVVDSVLGYVKGCFMKGVKLESWKLTFKEGLIWLENEEIRVRIRSRMKNESIDYVSQIGKQIESTEAKRPLPKVTDYDLAEKGRIEWVRQMRRAGLLGTDRAGTW